MKKISVSIFLFCAVAVIGSAQGSKLYRSIMRNPIVSANSTPKDTAYYVIIAGQSNAVGRADTSAIPLYHKFLKDTVQGFIYNSGTFEKIRAGVNTQGNNGQFGLEVSLVDTAFKNIGKRLYVVKYAVGGTAICSQGVQYWLPSLNNNLFQNLKNTILNANTIIQSNNLVAVPLCVIWVQGENDATDLTCANNYQSNLEGIIDSTRNYMGLPTLPFLIGLNNGDGDGLQVYRTTVRAAQQAVAKVEYSSYSSGFTPSNTSFTRDNTYLINTLNYTLFDGVHYSAASTIQLGHDIFKALNGQNIIK